MRPLIYGAFWIGVYLAVSAAPLFVMLIGSTPPGRGFWMEFSAGIGFAALSMTGLQFFLTGRFRTITLPYGIDVVYHFHRNISLIIFLFLVLHPAVLLISNPESVPLASFPTRLALGFAGLLAFSVIVLTSLYRTILGLRYERWRAVHGYLSVAAAAFSVGHIEGVNYYVQGSVKRGFWIVLVTSWILALVYVRIVKPAVMLRRPYTIEKVEKELGNSWTLTLRPDGHMGMTFQPGQFAWLTIGKSPFSILEHPFSFSSSAMRPDAVRMTIKELGDFTSHIGDARVGTRAYLDGPYGTFTIDRYAAPGFVFIAGGIGITPIMSILRTMADRHDKRASLLIYGVKTWHDVTFREELEELRELMNLKIVYVPENPPEDWTGEKGRITAELAARHLPENRMECEYFVCGPEPMQKAISNALTLLGLPQERVQSESFNFV